MNFQDSVFSTGIQLILEIILDESASENQNFIIVLSWLSIIMPDAYPVCLIVNESKNQFLIKRQIGKIRIKFFFWLCFFYEIVFFWIHSPFVFLWFLQGFNKYWFLFRDQSSRKIHERFAETQGKNFDPQGFNLYKYFKIDKSGL